MKFLLTRFFSLCLFVRSFIRQTFTESNTGWSYIQSTKQFFYIFISPMNIVDVLAIKLKAMEMAQMAKLLMSLIVD